MARKHVTRIAAGIAALVLLGIFLFRASPPGLLHTIQPPSGKPGFHTMALSPDGKTLATGSHRSSAITFWDVDTGKRTSTLDNGTTGIDRILYSPRGDQILVFY